MPIRDPLGAIWKAVAGSAGGASMRSVFGRRRLTKRVAGVMPSGRSAEYWRMVYAVVEDLWCSITPAHRSTWELGWKPPGMTGRDYFGRWNMPLVGRHDLWVRLRPDGRLLRAAQIVPPGAEPVPPRIRCQLGPDWLWQEFELERIEQRFRSATENKPTAAAAWAAAFDAVRLKSWAGGGGPGCANWGTWRYRWPGYEATAYQAECRFIFRGLPIAAWRSPALRWGDGSSIAGATGANYAMAGNAFSCPLHARDVKLDRTISPAGGFVLQAVQDDQYATPPWTPLGNGMWYWSVWSVWLRFFQRA